MTTPTLTVVPIPALKARRRPAGDAALIRSCVGYAMAVSASRNAFNCDPTGSTKFASAMSSRADREARRHLQRATGPATDPEGLAAKLRVVEIIFSPEEREAFPGLLDHEIEFLRSAATDALNYLAPVLHDRWLVSIGKTPVGGARS